MGTVFNVENVEWESRGIVEKLWNDFRDIFHSIARSNISVKPLGKCGGLATLFAHATTYTYSNSMGLWTVKKIKQPKPYYASMDDIQGASNETPRLQVTIGSIRGANSFNHLDSLSKSSKYNSKSNPYQFTGDIDFLRISSIGSGAYSTITKVLHRSTNTIMAKKIMTIEARENESKSMTETRILRELNLLSRCQSCYIVTYYGAYISNQHICIIMEYMDVGSLEFIYKRSGLITVEPLKIISLHALRGLLYLDEQGIVHRGIMQ
jgi:hypothetical protein